LRPYFPGGVFIALASPQKGRFLLTANTPPFTARTTRVSNPVCSLAFVPQCQVFPGTRLRHWCSSRYLRISLLHREFQSPLQTSSKVVSNAISKLSLEISHPTYLTTYAPFTPSESEQRSGPLYYAAAGTELAVPSSFATINASIF